METLKINALLIRQRLTKQLASFGAFGSLTLRYSLLLVGLLALGWLCSDTVPTHASLAPELGEMKEQSFFAPQVWAQQLKFGSGAADEHPRLLADVNGDGKQDVVVFGNDGVLLATSTGTSFKQNPATLDFGYQHGWRVAKHVRLTGDLNGDGREDIVGFGDAGVYRALTNGLVFGTTTFVVANFGYNQGWRVDKHVRLLADVNGDGRQDIVAFGDAGVWLALALPGGYFSAPTFVLANFGSEQGWRNTEHIRTTADVNGDGRQDLVGFGDYGVWLALSTGTGFTTPQLVLADFGYLAGSWKVERHPRLLADMNHDGKQDIVGFGDYGVWIAHSTGNGFSPAQYVLANFGYHQSWRGAEHPRFVADLNGDGYLDIVGFGDEAVYRALGGPGGFTAMRSVLRDLVVAEGQFSPRFVADVNGDGLADLVAFHNEESAGSVAVDNTQLRVARSSTQPPLPAPVAPSNFRITITGISGLGLAWNDNSNDERRFYIHYSKNGEPSQKIKVGANTTTYTFSSLPPDTQYCFSIQAENLWDLSPRTPEVCGRTLPAPKPTPTPTPTPTQGFSSLNVFNCNVGHNAVHLWTFDFTLNLWEERGTLAAQYDGGGSCPGSAAPFVVSLKDGHTYQFVAVDPQLPVCGANDPSASACQRALFGPLKGDAKGPGLPYVVN